MKVKYAEWHSSNSNNDKKIKPTDPNDFTAAKCRKMTNSQRVVPNFAIVHIVVS